MALDLPDRLAVRPTHGLGEVYLWRLKPELAAAVTFLAQDVEDDPAITANFPITIKSYSNSFEESKMRLQKLYSSEPERNAGYLIYYPNPEDLSVRKPAGMVNLSLRGERYASRLTRLPNRIDGINLSLFLEPGSRGQGLGTAVCRDVLDIASSDLTTDRSNGWFGKEVWTAILADNVPSQSLIENLGFELVGGSLLHGLETSNVFRQAGPTDKAVS